MLSSFGILNRMLFWELLRVFLFCLTGLTGICLIAGLVQQAQQMGLSQSQILQAIPLLIPTTLPWTIPATTLFASCVVYGRLANDNEIVAIKAAGIDLYTILRPAVGIGLVTAAVTGGLAYSVIPRTWQQLQAQIMQDPEEVLYNLLKKERRYSSPSFPYSIFVRDVQGRRLIDVIVKRRKKVPTQNGAELYHDYDVVARAREAKLVVDLDKGTLSIDPDRWVVNGQNTVLETEGNRPMDIPLPDMFSAKNIKARPMSLEFDELPGRIAEWKQKLAEREAARQANREKADREPDPEKRKLYAAQDMHHKAQIDDANRQIRNVEYEMWSRPAIAVGCLCFALIGCPVGIWSNRADYLSTFVICFLPTVMVYYPLMLAGGGLAKDGKVPMLVGVWGANAAAAFAALVLTWRLIRR